MTTLLLAPMEGLLDTTLRDVLTRVGGVDGCVSEFIRVTHMLLPHRVFTRIVPELRKKSRTAAGCRYAHNCWDLTPCVWQKMPRRLAELAPAGIDLNFGCPAKAVNQHRGGAVLLQEPELLYRIAGAVRRAVPEAIAVSAKMRLGYNDDSLALECAQALAAGG